MAGSVRLVARALEFTGCFLAIGGGPKASSAQNCNSAGIVLSTVGVMGLAVFDIATAPSSVRRYNERRLSVAPYVNPRDRSYGVSVSWSFRTSTPGPRGISHRPSPVVSDSVGPPKSPLVGFALSFVSTAAPMAVGVGLGPDGGGPAVFLAGVMVGPSVGHFYAGRVVRGLGTIALRGAGVALGVASLAGCFID